MAKNQFPVIPVILGVGLLGGLVYFLTKEDKKEDPKKGGPEKRPSDSLPSPGNKTVPIISRVKSPYIVAPLPAQCNPGSILFWEGDPILSGSYGGWGIDPVTGRRYKCIAADDPILKPKLK